MTKKILILLFLIVATLSLTGCNQKDIINEVNDANFSGDSNQYSVAQIKKIPEKIEVVHFHATQQCWSCITVGEYALKTIKERFPEEYKNGTIIYKDINGELPENEQMVNKYQARGSSLFINTIIKGQDNIEEDVTVWRLVVNEIQFINYFANKLNNLLGK